MESPFYCFESIASKNWFVAEKVPIAELFKSKGKESGPYPDEAAADEAHRRLTASYRKALTAGYGAPTIKTHLIIADCSVK